MRPSKQRTLASVLVILCLSVPGGTTTVPAPGSEHRLYTVILDSPSVGRRLTLARGKPVRQSQARLSAGSIARMGLVVERTQEPVSEALADLGIQVLGSVQNVLNAVFVRATAVQARNLASLSGVARVVPGRTFRLQLDSVKELVGLRPVGLGPGPLDRTGEGVKIAIVDSGVDLHHEAFRDESLAPLPGYPRGRPEHLRFASRKVIALRTYLHLLNSYDVVDSTPDDTSPQDASGHGTAVAMIAAGRRVNSPVGPVEGIAPKAYLGIYKVGGTPGINSEPTTQALLAAIDDAVADGMDIINLSLGAPARVPWNAYGHDCGAADEFVGCDPVAVAAQSAVVEFGRVVVASSGNEADRGLLEMPAMGTTGSPAIAPDVIAVGAVSNSRQLLQAVRAGDEVYAAQRGDGPDVDGSLTASLVLATDIGDPFGCVPLPSSSGSGRILLVERGNCTFERKIENAHDVGAVGVIIYNDIGTDELVKMTLTQDTDIPAFFVGKKTGAALIAQFRQSQPSRRLDVTMHGDPVRQVVDPTEVAAYSSRGPSPGLNLKPDIVAPGTHVYSAAVRQTTRSGLFSPSGFREATGTSMSAPVVAGAAALVWEAFPHLSSREVASVLINSASRTPTENGQVARVTSAGSGLLNIAGALETNTTVEPPTVGFGFFTADHIPVWQELFVTNRSSFEQSYRMVVEPRDTDPRAAVTLDGFSEISFQLGPDEFVRIRVALEGGPSAAGSYEGRLRLSGSGSVSELLVPFLYVVGDSQPHDAFPLTLDYQQGAAGVSTVRRIAAKFVDRHGAPVPGLPVHVSLLEGTALIQGQDTTTDSFGVAEASVEYTFPTLPTVVAISGGDLHVPFDFDVNAVRPRIERVADTATRSSDRVIAPGALISVFGSGFAEFGGEALPSYLPLALKGVSASFDFPEMRLSLAAPVVYVRSAELGLQVPWELAGLNFAYLKVRSRNPFGPDFTSDPVLVDLGDVAPGIFSVETAAGPAPMLQHPDGSLVSATLPARAGGTVTVLMTGTGPGQRPALTGQADTEPNPLAHPVSVTVAGRPATVSYAGSLPEAAGMSQVRFRVPRDSPTGSLDLVVSVHGLPSNTVTLEVR